MTIDDVPQPHELLDDLASGEIAFEAAQAAGAEDAAHATADLGADAGGAAIIFLDQDALDEAVVAQAEQQLVSAVAGLEMALEFVRSFHYNLEDIAFLQQIRDYDPAFLDHLSELRFSGEILAMPEGSIAFPNEPLLRVTAPFAEALLLESGLLQACSPGTSL